MEIQFIKRSGDKNLSSNSFLKSVNTFPFHVLIHTISLFSSQFSVPQQKVFEKNDYRFLLVVLSSLFAAGVSFLTCHFCERGSVWWHEVRCCSSESSIIFCLFVLHFEYFQSDFLIFAYASQLSEAERSTWQLRVRVGSQSISPLHWALRQI